MRPSSDWRKQTDDATVDIFGNKKRGGGGDPIRANGGSIVSNLSQYKVLQQKVNPSTAITANTLSAVIEPSNSLPPHLRSSMHHALSDHYPPANNAKTDPINKMSNELFRHQLDEQIAAQREHKRLQKMKEIEEEKLSQQKVQKEMQQLHSKHLNEINVESNGNAGFLRYRNSHSHIPPSDSMLKNQAVDEVKQTENITQNNNNDIHNNIYNNANYSSNINDNQMVIPNNTNSLEMELLEEKLRWKQKISEQELELRKLKLQMLQQQNDQKTTLQYLLKLQTDFTEQIYQSNQSNKMNIKRPLSGLQQPVSIQSSMVSIPEINGYTSTNLTRAPPTPQTPQHIQTTQIPQTPQAQDVFYNNYHPSIPGKDTNRRLPEMIGICSPSPMQYKQQSIATNQQQYMTSNMKNVVSRSVSPQQSSYFPLQPMTSSNQNHYINHNNQNNQNHIYHVPEQHPAQSVYFNQTSQPTSTRNSSYRTSPIAVKSQHVHMEEEKQESFLVNTEDNQFGALLSTQSSFFEYSDDDTDSLKERLYLQNNELCNSTQFEASSRPLTAQPHNNTQQLMASTTFELSSRPTTAIPSNVVIESKDTPKKPLSPVEQSVISNNSYSSFSGNKQIEDDPFAIHVVNDNEQNNNHEPKQNVFTESNDDWKQISDIDRDNVESLRDALQEIVSSCNDNITEMIEEVPEMIEEVPETIEEVPEMIEEEVPVPTPNTSMNRETFVVKYAESKQNEDQCDNEEEYEQDFDNESETEESKKKHDVLRLPDLDASINNFESKIYSVYSSFDNESMLTNSVASSSDFSNKSRSPQRMIYHSIAERVS